MSGFDKNKGCHGDERGQLSPHHLNIKIGSDFY
jgi:hypothetical protein